VDSRLYQESIKQLKISYDSAAGMVSISAAVILLIMVKSIRIESSFMINRSRALFFVRIIKTNLFKIGVFVDIFILWVLKIS